MRTVQTNHPINIHIERVRAKRQSSINYCQTKLDCLFDFKNKITYLESERLQLLQQSSQFAQLLIPLEQCTLDRLNQQIDLEIKAWQDLLKRCSRETINFGVAGAARQGKSTFLQRITGLSDGELPTSNGLPCTSVQSNIYHHEEKNCAIVKCFSETSFLDKIIRPYYHKLGFASPANLDEFARLSLPPRPINSPNPSESDALYSHLENYHAPLKYYRHLLKPEADSFEIEREDIARYVSQQYNHLSQPVNFEHLAVSEVDIYCKFPNNQVQNIGFVDTIGLGDTRLGDTERLMNAVGQEVDFIILIRRASPDGDMWKKSDIELYDRANQALLNKLPLAKCSAMVFNLDGNNQDNTNLLKNTMLSKGLAVSQTLEINCDDFQATSQVLQQLLTYLADNIAEFDRLYMSECECSYQALMTTVDSEIERIVGVLAQFQSSDEQFIRLCEPKIEELYTKVENLRHTQSTSTTLNPHFQAQIDLAIQKCQAIPVATLSELSTIRDVYAVDLALRKGIEILRPKLLEQFHTLDVSLNQSLAQQKNEIATMLAEWCLSNFSVEQGVELLAETTANLPLSLTNLQLGFKFLTEFEIQYRGLIQSEIYKSIDIALPADKRNPIYSQSGNYDLPSIQAELEARRTAALENCRESLENLSQSLHEASISMLEEWVAHITQADEVRNEWRIFLNKYRDDIWEDLQVVTAVGNWLEELTQLTN
jgi:hypothetical protein